MFTDVAGAKTSAPPAAAALATPPPCPSSSRLRLLLLLLRVSGSGEARAADAALVVRGRGRDELEAAAPPLPPRPPALEICSRPCASKRPPDFVCLYHPNGARIGFTSIVERTTRCSGLSGMAEWAR